MKPPHNEQSLRDFLKESNIDVLVFEEALINYQAMLLVVIGSTHHFDDPMDYVETIEYFDALDNFLKVLAYTPTTKPNELEHE